MKQSDHVLYITLVDFLLQLLFLSLLVAVIYISTQPKEEDLQTLKEQTLFVEKIKKPTGISDLTVLTDQLSRLGPLNSALDDARQGREFKAVANKIGGEGEALKILKTEASKGSGPISCLPNNGRLATFDAYLDRIEHQGAPNGEFLNVLKILDLTPSDIISMSLADFQKKFSPIRKIKDDCLFFVDVVEHSYDTRPRDSIRRIFVTYPRKDSSLK